MKRSLRPRANFVALRHADGTYTRYVHLQRNGVLVQLGEVRIKKNVFRNFRFDVFSLPVAGRIFRPETLHWETYAISFCPKGVRRHGLEWQRKVVSSCFLY